MFLSYTVINSKTTTFYVVSNVIIERILSNLFVLTGQSEENERAGKSVRLWAKPMLECDSVGSGRECEAADRAGMEFTTHLRWANSTPERIVINYSKLMISFTTSPA